jgi:hypothetical protein
MKKKINNNMAKKMAKKAEKKKITESGEIVNFLTSISQKNYSEANKYLQNVVDLKLKTKIGLAQKEKLF